MKKCVVISDSFKGSISSIDIGNIAKASASKFFPECSVVSIPVADGGEGTVDCFLEALGGERIETSVTGPLGGSVAAHYGLKNKTAFIEMAAAAGLPLIPRNKLDPMRATTFGVGQQIKDAVENGAESIILGLGGSATNDGGCGCAAALGVKFYDKSGAEFIPSGGTLDKIDKIDISRCKELLSGVKITAMCDIDNPLYGETGAAYVFAPQKGADDDAVKFLDHGLVCLSNAIIKNLGADVSDIPGSGAAGGFGAGAVAFLGAELCPGIEAVLNTVSFDDIIKDADLVLTGEGRLDSQSLRGKVISGVARRTKAAGVPCVALVGDVRDDAYGAYDLGVTAIFSTNRLAIPFSQAKQRSREDYIHTLEDIFRLVKALNF